MIQSEQSIGFLGATAMVLAINFVFMVVVVTQLFFSSFYNYLFLLAITNYPSL